MLSTSWGFGVLGFWGFGWLWLALTGLGWAWLGFVGPSWRDFGGSFQAWGRGKGKPFPEGVIGRYYPLNTSAQRAGGILYAPV